jgi:DNA-binding NarL/FixJ family response regulator
MPKRTVQPVSQTCHPSAGRRALDPARSRETPGAAASTPAPLPETTLQKAKVLLADDHNVVRQGFRLLLEAEPDIVVVGEAETGRQAVQLAQKLRPDVVLMDIAMPLLNGLEATRQILKEVPTTRVVILSSYSDDEYVRQLAEAGTSGYLVKQTAAADLVKAIREARKGNAFFSPTITQRLVEQYRGRLTSGVPVRQSTDLLTSREVEVLQLIAEGRANKQIAGELGLSIKTVETHRQRLMNKLKIHDIAGLTRYALAKGIIESTVLLRYVAS